MKGISFLTLEGKMSLELEKELGIDRSQVSVDVGLLYFSSYSPATFPLNYSFDGVFELENPNNVFWVSSKIIFVTQQFGKSFDEVPEGWKTILGLSFNHPRPSIVSALPIVGNWGKNSKGLGLITYNEWESFIEYFESKSC